MCKIVCNKSLTSNFIEMSLYGEDRMGCDGLWCAGRRNGRGETGGYSKSFITEIVVLLQ